MRGDRAPDVEDTGFSRSCGELRGCGKDQFASITITHRSVRHKSSGVKPCDSLSLRIRCGIARRDHGALLRIASKAARSALEYNIGDLMLTRALARAAE